MLSMIPKRAINERLTTERLRRFLRFAMHKLNLAGALGRFREVSWRRHFSRFEREYGRILSYNPTNSPPNKRALVVSGPHTSVGIDLFFIKALELAGFEPVTLVLEPKQHGEYYRLAGVKQIYFLSDFTQSLNFSSEAKTLVESARSVRELLTFEFAGANVGKIAISTTLRELRRGSLDLQSEEVCERLTKQIAASMAYATASKTILRQIRPDCTLFPDVVYTRRAELFDNCVGSGIPAIRWHPAHKSNALIFKRYTRANKSQHPISLSSESWQLIRQMSWSESYRADLQQELFRSYATGDWYSESGTQFNKVLLSAGQIQRQLGLDPGKKTAVIFPHILWDAPLTWGENLFDNYEEWLIETVQAACSNDKLNWIIKIHPANVGKQMKEGVEWEPAEVAALREHFSKLPPHIFLIPAESEINTFSLFESIDYCLTIRGTIGIEAASFGIPVFTAGTGRYDHLGFTIDSESREEYLTRIGHIQDIPRLSPAQRELAERFAYGIFLLRPLPLRSVTLEYHQDHGSANNFTKTRLNIKAGEEWSKAADLQAFARWLTDSSDADFLIPPASRPSNLS